jgi:hypothetical protein
MQTVEQNSYQLSHSHTHHHRSPATNNYLLNDFNNVLVDRLELTTLLDSFYRRDLAALFKIAELGSHDSFIKVEGINYHHSCFQLQEKFHKRNQMNQSSLNAFSSLNSFDKFTSGQTSSSGTSQQRKTESNAFDIDALIEMTYNS